MLTPQQIYERAWTGLAMQGFEQAVNERGFCTFEAADGKRCAIGWVAPQLTAEDNGTAVRVWKNNRGHLGDLVSHADIILLIDLQHAHDQSASPEEMRSNMVEVAKQHNLAIPGIDD